MPCDNFNAYGCFWMMLAAFGCFWLLLAAFGCFWLRFGCFLAISDSCWQLLAVVGSCFGYYWLLLATFGQLSKKFHQFLPLATLTKISKASKGAAFTIAVIFSCCRLFSWQSMDDPTGCNSRSRKIWVILGAPLKAALLPGMPYVRLTLLVICKNK